MRPGGQLEASGGQLVNWRGQREGKDGRQVGEAAHLCGQWAGESLKTLSSFFRHLMIWFNLSSGGHSWSGVGLYLTDTRQNIPLSHH